MLTFFLQYSHVYRPGVPVTVTVKDALHGKASASVGEFSDSFYQPTERHKSGLTRAEALTSKVAEIGAWRT